MKKISLILVLILIASSLGCALPGIAFAASETVYSSVLEDLGKDETFDVAQFVAAPDDYSLQVIQIAESNVGELFVYVYIPANISRRILATSINISTAINDSLHYENYTLTLLSEQGVLSKYIVDDFVVKSDTVRYYDISAIFRKWEADIDTVTNNTVSEVSYAVGKLYTACTIDGAVTYTEVHQDVIEVIGKYCGFIRYPDGFQLFPTACDSHFVAFSTDIKIDELYDADVSFVEQSYKYTYYDNDITGRPETIDKVYGDKQPQQVTVHSEEVSHQGGGWFAQNYTWNRIETVDEFKSNNKLTNIAEKELEGKQWVLRFTETDFSKTGALTYYTEQSTLVSEVTILRLHFKTAGQVYNLGVVDNKQTGSDEPVNEDNNALAAALRRLIDSFQKIIDWLAENWWVIIVAVVVVVMVASLFFQVGRQVLGAIFTAIGKALWWFVKYLGIGLFYVITSPYWIIRAIVLKVREKRGG